MGGETLNLPSTPRDSQPGTRPSFLRRSRWIWWVSGAILMVLGAVGIFLSVVAHRFEPYIRQRIVEGLQQRFHTRVELADFHVSVHEGLKGEWGMWATGRGLRIWPPHREGGDHPLEIAVQSKPLIDLGEFSFHVPLRYETAQHLHITEVRLKKLIIEVPPRSERDKHTGIEAAMAPSGPAMPPEGTPESGQPGSLSNVTVDRVICEDADLTLETDKPGKVPLEFEIAHLKLMHLAAGKPMDFEAELTNPQPRGVIDTSGRFGPWNMADPGESPVSGRYHFDHADLSTFNGIAGILSSNGDYVGALRQIAVDGKSDVPDFRLTSFGNPVPLHVTFHARVDGTDGDTWLEPVDATLGHSHFTTSGKVVRVFRPATGSQNVVPVVTRLVEGKPPAGRAAASEPVTPAQEIVPARQGHLIDLKVAIDRGNMDDFMRLVSRSPIPLLTGNVFANATLHIPPGDEPVHLRMKLDGNFKLSDAHFTSPKIQDKIEELSLRGQGKPDALKTTDPNSIQSGMEGVFHLEHGVIALPDLHYAVPGADIQLEGKYSLDGNLNFEGTAHMQATVSQMVGGWKGFLLKPVDRFFKKDGSGTLVPIHIRGSREAPEFGVDLGRKKQTSPERPGAGQR